MPDDPLLACPDCAQTPCASVCLDHAIVVVDPLHSILVRNDLCIGCGLCTTACPFDRLEVNHAACRVRSKV